jgi:hypothetical protein
VIESWVTRILNNCRPLFETRKCLVSNSAASRGSRTGLRRHSKFASRFRVSPPHIRRGTDQSPKARRATSMVRRRCDGCSASGPTVVKPERGNWDIYSQQWDQPCLIDQPEPRLQVAKEPFAIFLHRVLCNNDADTEFLRRGMDAIWFRYQGRTSSQRDLSAPMAGRGTFLFALFGVYPTAFATIDRAGVPRSPPTCCQSVGTASTCAPNREMHSRNLPAS